MKKLSAIFSTVLLSLSFAIFSVNANSIKNEDVYQYFELSGTKSALQSIPAQIQSMSQQMKIVSKDPEESTKVMNSLSAAWNESVIENLFIEHVKKSYTVEELATLLEWLETDLVRRVKQAEEKSTAANFNQEFMQYMANIQTSPPSESRVKAVRNFIESTNLVDLTMSMVVDIAKGVSKSLQTVDSNEISDEQVEAQLVQMESMMKPQMEQQLILVSYYIYDEISDKDINEYSAFYQQALGQKELKVSSKAFKNAFGEWTATALKGVQTK